MNSFHFFWCTSKWKEVHWRSNNQTTPRKGKVCCVCQHSVKSIEERRRYTSRVERGLRRALTQQQDKYLFVFWEEDQEKHCQSATNYLRHATCACFWTTFWKQTLWGPTVPQWDLCSYSWTTELAGLPLVPCSLHGFTFIQFYLRTGMHQYTATVNSKHIVF